jgi:hypothetical protein
VPGQLAEGGEVSTTVTTSRITRKYLEGRTKSEIIDFYLLHLTRIPREYVVQDGDMFDSRRGADFFKSADDEWAYCPTEDGHDGKRTACNGETFVCGFASLEEANQHAYAAWHEAESDRACEVYE